VAKLPDPVLTNIFTLQRRIIESIDATTTLVDRDLLKQRRARLLYKSNYIPTETVEN
jgi:hypothetical protein